MPRDLEQSEGDEEWFSSNQRGNHAGKDEA
jgi:hypothetical protein